MLIKSATAVTLSKKGTNGLLAALATLGVTSDNIPLYVAITVGLFGGTAAAWARERQSGTPLGPGWLFMQMAAYVMIFVLVLALVDYPGLTVRWSAAVAALLSFSSREGLLALHKRTLKEIETRDVKPGD